MSLCHSFTLILILLEKCRPSYSSSSVPPSLSLPDSTPRLELAGQTSRNKVLENIARKYFRDKGK